MRSLLLYSVIAFIGLMFTSSCHKKKQHTSVKVIVLKTSDGLPAVGATVRVYANVSGTTVDDTQTSDVNGEAFFSYDDIFQLGQASVAILDVDCTLATKVGSGVVKVESEKETPITISVN